MQLKLLENVKLYVAEKQMYAASTLQHRAEPSKNRTRTEQEHIAEHTYVCRTPWGGSEGVPGLPKKWWLLLLYSMITTSS